MNKTIAKLTFCLLLCLPLSVLAQQKKDVRVVVSDELGAMPGVSVLVKGTSVGDVTDGSGVVLLRGVSPDATLIVSMLGYTSQEVPVAGRSDIEVTLSEDRVALEETVVVGFATQKKINVTGSVAMLDAESLASIPVQNAVQALQGQIAGLSISSPNGGQLDAKNSVSVRGLGTIGEGSSGSALVLIDGVEGDLSIINPQDIESISVLKDAAASSIYGSRAPFGVILVTTKKGTKGRAVINYNNSFRISQPINMPRMADSYSFALLFNDAAYNTGVSPWFSDEQLQRIQDYQNGVIDYNTLPLGSNPSLWSHPYDNPRSHDNIDYYSALYKKITFAQEHNLSISGASEMVNYYLSANYVSDEGKMTFGGDGRQRVNVFGKLSAQVKPWLRVGYSGRYIRYDYHCPTRMEENNFFDQLGKETWPIYPLYDPNGNLFSNIAIWLRDGGQTRKLSSTHFHQFNLEITPLPWLKLYADATYRGGSRTDHRERLSYHQIAIDGSKGEEWYNYNDLLEQRTTRDYFNANSHLDFEKDWNGHYVKVMLGFQAEYYAEDLVSASIKGVSLPGLATIHTSTGLGQDGTAVPPTVNGTIQQWSTAGFFGRVNYNYKDRYMVEANLRYDGSSRFRSGTRWGLFPSVSAGWNLAKEPWFQGALGRSISTLKLRASYGRLGNQNTTKIYPTYSIMPVSIASGSWLIDGLRPNVSSTPSLISTSLTWEKVNTLNAGLDVAALKDRLSFSFDYYIRDTENMVGPADELPAILGTAVPKMNNTNLRTSGFDAEIMWKDQIRDFSYSARFILSDAQSVVTRYSNPSGSLSESNGDYNYYTGKHVGEIWGFETIGIARSNDEMNAHLATLPNGGQSNLGNDWQAGDIMYRDLNGDGKIDKGANTVDDHGDLTVIGNTTPRFQFGLDLNLAWRGIDFRLFFQGVGKRDYLQLSRYFFGAFAQNWDSMALVQHMDYFRSDPNHPLGQNLDSYFTRPLWDQGVGKNRQRQTRWMQDASYLRLKNLQLGYTFPQKWMEAVHIDKVRIFFSGENLFTLTKMIGIFDPETIEGGNGTGNTYPLSRTYSFGLSVTF